MNAVAQAILEQELWSSSSDPERGLALKLVGICSVNRREWLITDMAANSVEVTTVPLYETLGPDMLALILEQTRVETVFGSAQNLETMLRFVEEREVGLRRFVCFDEEAQELAAWGARRGIQVLFFRDLLRQKGEQARVLQARERAGLESVFTISYTSGTTNNSKGVVVSNRNFIGALTNIRQVGTEFAIHPSDSYISYLPLAHVFDRLGCYSCLSVGASVGFFGGDLLKIPDDLVLLRPTLFASVPRLLNKVYDKILKRVQDGSYLKQYLFNKGVNAKVDQLKLDGQMHNRLYDQIVFNKARQRLGGNIRLMITASAPIAPNILQFLKVVFCCPIVEAYG